MNKAQWNNDIFDREIVASKRSTLKTFFKSIKDSSCPKPMG